MALASIVNEDPFDGDTEPIVFMSTNRMPVIVELGNACIYIFFAALVLTLILILPGLRKTKLTSLIGLVSLLVLMTSILLAINGTHWLTGSIHVQDLHYTGHSTDTITGNLGAAIGLSSINITLNGMINQSNQSTVYYNERFHWNDPEQISHGHLEALKRGLPHPILTITEFLSQDSENFNWSRKLRSAGYYTVLMLYLAAASWHVTVIVMCVLPIYLPIMMQITGSLVMASVWIYTFMIQSPNFFPIYIGGKTLELSFGYTYITTFVAGAMSVIAGMLLLAVQIHKPDSHQFTMMDSEQWVQNQKATHPVMITNQKKPKPKIITRSDSVIIPIEDIEKNFQKKIEAENLTQRQ